MDPNETLKDLRALLSGETVADNLHSLAVKYAEAEELFQALDEWLSKGNPPPTDWDICIKIKKPYRI